MSASAKKMVRLNKRGFRTHNDRRARKFIKGLLDASEFELSDRGDLKFKTQIERTAQGFSGELCASSDKRNLLKAEFGTERTPPSETIGSFVKDPAIRGRIIRSAAQKLT